jgi:glycine dehydrogenase subunit 1
MAFIPTTEKNRREMLDTIGVRSIDELLAGSVPDDLRFKGELDLPPALSEFEVEKLLREIAAQNEHAGTHVCFLGGGAYDHFIPAAVKHVVSRPEFYTSYTPYQPEVAQGNLQAMYEYQSLVCELTGMDAANASLYDGASALAEAALMAQSHTGRPEILVPLSVHPWYRRVLKTYCHRSGITVREIPLRDGTIDPAALAAAIGPETAAVLVQHPNFFGLLEPVREIEPVIHGAGAVYVTSSDPISLGILEPPGEFGADVATGEGQALGNPLNFGGPYLGLFAVKQDLIRRMPGRLVGATQDGQGRRGFVLTLQTREQHIRREKAASSICTNQQLCALAATVYLTLMGRAGLPKVAELSLRKAHYLADRLAAIPGFSLMFPGPFFKEFALKTPVPAARIIGAMRDEGIFAGVDLGRFDLGVSNGLLIAVTEKRTAAEMDRFARLLAKHFAVRRPAPPVRRKAATGKPAGSVKKSPAGSAKKPGSGVKSAGKRSAAGAAPSKKRVARPRAAKRSVRPTRKSGGTKK